MILEQDRKRLKRSFRSVGKASGATAAGAAAAAASAKLALGTDATHAFWEVLSYWQLLEDGGIREAFSAALARVGGCTCMLV